MKSKNPIIYWTILGLNTDSPCVRQTRQNGETRSWFPEDRGYKSAYARAVKANKR